MVQKAQVLRQGEQTLLDADIDFGLSGDVTDALANGVPISVVVEACIIRARPVWWDENILNQRWRYRLIYHSLTGVYQIQSEDGTHRHFASLDAAVAALGRLRNLSLHTEVPLMLGVAYKLRVRTWLDIEQLPLPLRAPAYLHPQWDLHSPWFRRSFAV